MAIDDRSVQGPGEQKLTSPFFPLEERPRRRTIEAGLTQERRVIARAFSQVGDFFVLQDQLIAKNARELLELEGVVFGMDADIGPHPVLTQFVVGPDPGDPYPTIGAAIAAAVLAGHDASNPALILVKPKPPGYNEAVTIQPGMLVQAVTINPQGRTGATNGGAIGYASVKILGGVTYSPLADHAGTLVNFASWVGIDIQNDSGPALTISGHRGHLRLGDCRIVGSSVSDPTVLLSDGATSPFSKIEAVSVYFEHTITDQTIIEGTGKYQFEFINCWFETEGTEPKAIDVTGVTATAYTFDRCSIFGRVLFGANTIVDFFQCRLSSSSASSTLTATGTSLGILQLVLNASSSPAITLGGSTVAKISVLSFQASTGILSGIVTNIGEFYDNTISSLTAVNVKTAIDELKVLVDAAAVAPIVISDVLYVDVNAAGGGDGSITAPFDTIAGAITAASTNDTAIFITPGTYAETLTINNAATTIALIALGRGTVLIQGNNASGNIVSVTSTVTAYLVGIQIENTNDAAGAIALSVDSTGGTWLIGCALTAGTGANGKALNYPGSGSGAVPLYVRGEGQKFIGQVAVVYQNAGDWVDIRDVWITAGGVAVSGSVAGTALFQAIRCAAAFAVTTSVAGSVTRLISSIMTSTCPVGPSLNEVAKIDPSA